MEYTLRPGVTNPELWYPERPSKYEWNKIRQLILGRDKNTCQFCGHTAKKFMNVHHVNETNENSFKNLISCCVACHSVLHMGRSLSLKVIEIWEASISQVEIIQITRKAVSKGFSLEEIKETLPLNRGKYNPKSTNWANSLLDFIGDEPRASLEEPLCAVFIDLKRWQIEEK